MTKKLNRTIAAAFLGFALWSSEANAQLAKSDFFASGDGLLVTDTATGIQWLAPYATRGVTINDILGGYDGLATTYGFSYANSSEVLSMINTNFGNPPVGSPGTAAGYIDAANFFDVFGINEQVGCYNPGGDPACPRTQGFTVDGGGATVTQIGMLQFNGDGYLIDVSNGGLSVYGDYGGPNALQLGSWLVRPASAELATPLTAPVPEPSTWALMLLGLGAIGIAARRNRKADRLPQLA